MALNLGRFYLGQPSNIIWIGDSVTGTFNGSTSPAVVAERIVRALFGTVVGPALGSPFLPPVYKSASIGSQDGAAGRECKTIAPDQPTMDAYLLLISAPFTHAVIQLGINDAVSVQSGATTFAVFNAASAMIISRLIAKKGIPGSNILWLGASSHPTPAIQTVLTGQIDPAIQANCTAVGGTYLVNSMLDSTTGVNTIDGIHPNDPGSILWGTRWATGFNVTG
jgi:hypothetical protein